MNRHQRRAEAARNRKRKPLARKPMDIDVARQQGYDEGRQDGLREGRAQGLIDGRKNGLVASEAYEEGRKKGYIDGRKDGLREGLKDARRRSEEELDIWRSQLLADDPVKWARVMDETYQVLTIWWRETRRGRVDMLSWLTGNEMAAARGCHEMRELKKGKSKAPIP